jgi:hypothetical protein
VHIERVERSCCLPQIGAKSSNKGDFWASEVLAWGPLLEAPAVATGIASGRFDADLVAITPSAFYAMPHRHDQHAWQQAQAWKPPLPGFAGGRHAGPPNLLGSTSHATTAHSENSGHN